MGAAFVLLLIGLSTIFVAKRCCSRRLELGPQCSSCGYSLRALQSSSCPECGADLQASEPANIRSTATSIEGLLISVGTISILLAIFAGLVAIFMG